ncbi:hypothetical protein OH492_27155 [Vibrio chagasii]|nr:hypothetical protein [Vibrio chagasii]
MKPVRVLQGKGQSVIKNRRRYPEVLDYAQEGGRTGAGRDR